MNRLITRPRSLLLAVALAVVAALCPVSTADAASSASEQVVPATPSNLTATAAGTTSIQLTWTNNADNQSGVVISLDGQESVDVQGATVSSYTWNGLSPNTQYWFYIASKIYGTPGDPTGYGNTQSAWVGPVYAITVGTHPPTSPAPQPPTSPAPQPPTSPPPTSPAPQPPTAGSGVPTTLPTQPSPTFVCVTGPGGSCLEPGAGVPQQDSWASTPSSWLTSPLVAGCAFDIAAFVAFLIYIGVLPEVAVPQALLESIDFLDLLGTIVRYDEGNGNWVVGLTKAMPFSNCVQLAKYVRAGKPLPQSLDSSRSAPLPESADLLDSVDVSARGPSTPDLFQPVPESDLGSLTKLPFLRQRFGYAAAQVGSVAALSQKYPAAWGRGTQNSVVCQLQRGGYRCAWSYQLDRAHHSGYVLVAVTANNYRLAEVAEVAQAAPASPASGLSPLWYIPIAAVVVVIVAIVVAVLRRRRRATATAQ